MNRQDIGDRLDAMSLDHRAPAGTQTPLTVGTGDHQVVVHADSDWGGPVWAWSVCSCGRTGPEFSTYHPAGHPRHGYLAEAFADAIAHANADTAADLAAALATGAQHADDLAHLVTQAADAARTGQATRAADLLRDISRRADEATGPLADAMALDQLNPHRRAS